MRPAKYIFAINAFIFGMKSPEVGQGLLGMPIEPIFAPEVFVEEGVHQRRRFAQRQGAAEDFVREDDARGFRQRSVPAEERTGGADLLRTQLPGDHYHGDFGQEGHYQGAFRQAPAAPRGYRQEGAHHEESFFQRHRIKLSSLRDLLTASASGLNPHSICGGQPYVAQGLNNTPEDAKRSVLVSILLNAMFIPALFALVPASLIGALIAFASMLIGGSLMEYTTKWLALPVHGELPKLNLLYIFLSHIPISLGAGLCVFLATIPWAITIAAVIATVYVLAVRFIIDGRPLNVGDFSLLIPPINMQSIWLLYCSIPAGLLVALTITLQLINCVCAFFSFNILVAK